MQIKSEEMQSKQIKGEETQDMKPGVSGKIRIVQELNLPRAASDVLVQLCTPNIYTGANLYYFEQLSEMTDGEWLETQMGNYYGTAAGQVSLIDISETVCFKRLAISLLPTDFTVSNTLFDLYLCYRNALDKAAEEGFKTVAFIHPTMPHLLEELSVVRTALCAIGDWLDNSEYREMIHMVSIVCDDENNYYRYRRYNQEMAQRGDPFGINPRLRALLEPEPPKMEEGEGRATPEGLSIELLEAILQGEIQNYVATSLVYEPPIAIDPQDVVEWERLLRAPELIAECQNQLYEKLFRPQGMTNIQLSSHLKRRVLLVEEEETGRVWAMRYTYAHGEFGHTLHFVCITCDSACRNTGLIQRCFALVIDGLLQHNPADHHPECRPVSKSEVIMVQLKRRLKLHDRILEVLGIKEEDQEPFGTNANREGAKREEGVDEDGGDEGRRPGFA